MKRATRAILQAGSLLLLLGGHGACGGGGSPTQVATTTATTTTTTTTTTTSTTTSTTTTTTTTTTMPQAAYASVHPIWSNRGCTGCHTSSNRLNLGGSASATCRVVREGLDAGGGQYLDNPSCSSGGSSVLRVPSTALLPNNIAHPDVADGCFMSGGTCRRDLLAWCQAGAACP